MTFPITTKFLFREKKEGPHHHPSPPDRCRTQSRLANHAKEFLSLPCIFVRRVSCLFSSWYGHRKPFSWSFLCRTWLPSLMVFQILLLFGSSWLLPLTIYVRPMDESLRRETVAGQIVAPPKMSTFQSLWLCWVTWQSGVTIAPRLTWRQVDYPGSSQWARYSPKGPQKWMRESE